MKYYKRAWDECRGDEYDHWGTSMWYFEVNDELWITRQIESYANGTVLHYDSSHPEDRFGMLSDQPIDLTDGFLSFEISQPEFEAEWSKSKPYNL